MEIYIIYIVIVALILLFVLYAKITGMKDTIKQAGDKNNILMNKNNELMNELNAAKDTISQLQSKEMSQKSWHELQEIILSNQKQKIDEKTTEAERKFKQFEAGQTKLKNDTISEINANLAEFEAGQTKIKNDIISEINANLVEKEKAYKWIASLMADIKLWIAESKRDTGELIKTKRTIASRARVDVLLSEKRQLVIENAMLKYHLEYIKTLMPEVDNIVEFNDFEYQKDDINNPSLFLSREEYILLSDTEKNIRALEYYKQRKKGNWEIGRDFEMYVGYRFEQKGFTVIYFGMEKKLNDLGRDLIAKKDGETYVVQCKYWSREKQIHEKHLAQLYGTYIMYKLENPTNENVRAVFVTHTRLTEVARKFADMLGITIQENEELGEYPLIKCNVGRDEYGLETKIYHLPMDQQYDKIIIKQSEGDFMAFTIQEAEERGFRRAFKWHGGT